MAASLASALDLLNAPGRVRVVAARPLPADMTALLTILAGDAGAVQAAARETGRAPERIVEAATFFVEQILLAPRADPYRVLGAPTGAPTELLRAHMALLLRWAHPDLTGAPVRRVAATRIIAAWSALKTPEKRAAFEQAAQRPPSRPRGLRAGYGRRPSPRIGWLGALLSWFAPSPRSN